MVAPQQSPGGMEQAVVNLGGFVAATAPIWLFTLAAFSGLGPRTATLVFAIPVLGSTALTVWLARLVAGRGEDRVGRAIGVTGLVVGIVGYAAWVYLATLGATFGDGPL